MREGKRYTVQTKWGWFSLDEGAYQDYLAGKLWIGWEPNKRAETPMREQAPRNVSRQALRLREEAEVSGVFATATTYGSGETIIPDVARLSDYGIEELDMSVRASNGLRRAGIDTLGKLAAAMEQEGGLFRIRNLGAKSVKEIRTAFIEERYRRMLPYERAEYWQTFLERNSSILSDDS